MDVTLILHLPINLLRYIIKYVAFGQEFKKVLKGVSLLLNFLVLCGFQSNKIIFYNSFTTFKRRLDMIKCKKKLIKISV